MAYFRLHWSSLGYPRLHWASLGYLGLPEYLYYTGCPINIVTYTGFYHCYLFQGSALCATLDSYNLFYKIMISFGSQATTYLTPWTHIQISSAAWVAFLLFASIFTWWAPSLCRLKFCSVEKPTKQTSQSTTVFSLALSASIPAS
jgi:hypothetical protein